LVLQLLESAVCHLRPVYATTRILTSVWVRLALNYKGIEYKTVLVEFPDIQKVMAEVGASPSGQNPDGTPRYTVPTIYDPNHKTFVTDSLEIAKYLDKLHPESVLVPPGSEDLFKQLVLRGSVPVMLGTVRLGFPELIVVTV
jgi:glutathione S-transferase